jgi:hypothetical protein
MNVLMDFVVQASSSTSYNINFFFYLGILFSPPPHITTLSGRRCTAGLDIHLHTHTHTYNKFNCNEHLDYQTNLLVPQTYEQQLFLSPCTP